MEIISSDGMAVSKRTHKTPRTAETCQNGYKLKEGRVRIDAMKTCEQLGITASVT
jgi:hypothetical protein